MTYSPLSLSYNEVREQFAMGYTIDMDPDSDFDTTRKAQEKEFDHWFATVKEQIIEETLKEVSKTIEKN